IVFASGAQGDLMLEQIKLENEIKNLSEASNVNPSTEIKLEGLTEELLHHLNEHPGFGNNLVGFNTITQELFKITGLPDLGAVTTSAVHWGNDIVIPSGEIRPGVRTSKVLKIEVLKNISHLSLWDIIVVGVYFLVLGWMGYFFSKRQKTTEDYFKGGGRVPWWAAGLSVFGTALSAITFMAIPAKTFSTDWSYFVLNMTIFLVAPIIVFLFIPFYRKLNVTSAYEYLEQRFNILVRLIGSFSFILFQVGRMGVVLFLPAIALNVATGTDIFLCIGLMGAVSLIYTIMGGIEAVIWTDVLQVVVLLGGALLALNMMISNIDGGLQTVFETAANNHKFNLIDLNWSLKQPTLWVMLVGGIFANITTYGTDQTMVQRYLTTKSQKEAEKSVWTNAFLSIPATLLFFFIGTSLFVFYKTRPQVLNPILEGNDAIFPWYIISEMPSGFAGLLIAAIFAAAMSSLSSSMNSAATAYSTDIHFRFGLSKKTSRLKLAKLATLVLGLLGILFALLMATMDIKSLWDEFQKILGLVIGSLGGVFLLGMLSKKANSPGVLIGLVLSIVFQIVVAWNQSVHLLLYAATGVLSCFVFGYFASLFFKSDGPSGIIRF
ncbi:MAG: sodium:solute symporter family transporter, partial [Aurantibacter sp.]